MEINETHEKIINIIKTKGPSLPINISKQIGMSSLFISAFLSELANEKRVKVSALKVGGSPLYYLEGQEEQLEPYHKYLHPKEAETFLILKKNKILKDSEQDPATRVALRSIKDFASGFKHNNEIYWRNIQIPESEAKKSITPPSISVKSPKKQIETPKSREKITINKPQKPTFENPVVINSQTKSKKQKPKSEFVQRITNILDKNFQIVEEGDYKTKEYNSIIQVKSELGTINFLTLAKDKKTITETDLKKLLSESQKIPLPALLLYTGEVSKKAQEYLTKYSSILKAKKV